MNKQEKYKEDLLREFIYPERIEKAPEGFTSKVMTQIQIEALPLKPATRVQNKNLIPYISAAVTILLIAATFIFPGSKTFSHTFAFLDQMRNLKITLPEINLTSIFTFNLPAVMMYVIIGILLLTLFDRGLNMLFNKKEE
jgi:hypothetical protein